MNLAIDASPLLAPTPTGVGRVVREVLREFASRDTGHEIFAVSPDRAVDLRALGASPGVKGRVHAVAIPTAGARWRGRPAERFASERGIDVWWSTVSAFPRGLDCAVVATCHEAPWETSSARGDEGTGFNHRLWATLDAWFATRVVCPSKATADAFLSSHLRKSAKSKVVVIPWGVSSLFRREPDKDARARLEVYKFRQDYPYFLMVAAPRRIKNFELAIRALRIFRDRTGVDARLFVAGPRGTPLETALGYADALGLRMFVTAFDYVPDPELAELYKGARATLVLSRSEGFGFPVLESMACGTPVLHSGAGSLAEVAADAGLRVDTDDDEAVAAAMARIHTDDSLRTACIEKGTAQAARFAWSSTADRLLTLFDTVGGSAGALAHAGGHAAAH